MHFVLRQGNNKISLNQGVWGTGTKQRVGEASDAGSGAVYTCVCIRTFGTYIGMRLRASVRSYTAYPSVRWWLCIGTQRTPAYASVHLEHTLVCICTHP